MTTDSERKSDLSGQLKVKNYDKRGQNRGN
jgi:hypothetical protein